jgi:CheY-like chemotaxis protein
MWSGDDGATKRVLIVDDNADTRRLISACLSSVEGLVAEEAADGWSALRLIARREPDLVILDMNLPVIDGYLTLSTVRGWGRRFADLPILAFTGAAGPDIHLRCLRAGASDYIAKPLNPTALRSKVRTHLARPRTSDASRADLRTGP